MRSPSSPPSRVVAEVMPAIWTEEALYRYSRHLLLPEVGVFGQEKIHDIEATVTGTCLAGYVEASYLVGAGVGALAVPKNASWSKEDVNALNPSVTVRAGKEGQATNAGPMFFALGAGRAWLTLCDHLELPSLGLEELVPADPFGRS